MAEHPFQAPPRRGAVVPEGAALEEAHGHVVVEEVKSAQAAQAGGDERLELGVGSQVVLPVKAGRPAAQHVQRQGQLPPDRLVGEALVQELVGLQVTGALRGSQGQGGGLGVRRGPGALQGARCWAARAWPSAAAYLCPLPILDGRPLREVGPPLPG